MLTSLVHEQVLTVYPDSSDEVDCMSPNVREMQPVTRRQSVVVVLNALIKVCDTWGVPIRNVGKVIRLGIQDIQKYAIIAKAGQTNKRIHGLEVW